VDPRWLLSAATASQLFPFVGLFRFGRKLPTPRRWVLAWCTVFLLGDLVAIAVAYTMGRNLWTQYFITPVEDVLLLYTLSLWQRDSVARLTFRVAIPLFVIAWIGVVAIEGIDDFSLFAWPFQALVMLAASLFTLVRLTLAEAEGVTRRDWFWVSLGTSLYFAPVTALHPFAHAFIVTNPELVRFAFMVKAVLNILVFAIIARGMLCPLTPERSGGSSQQARWPSPSYSSPSAPHS
jgi:hypothetical protein